MKALPILAVLALTGCASHGITQDTITNPDGSTDTYNDYSKTAPFGMDAEGLQDWHCIDGKCAVQSSGYAFQRGFWGFFGPSAVMGGSFIAGEALRRPDQSTINASGGGGSNASATGGSSRGGSANASATGGSARSTSTSKAASSSSSVSHSGSSSTSGSDKSKGY